MGQKVDYIFSINTGRSGSHYLSNIFNHVTGCCSFHEPYPYCRDKVMRKYLADMNPVEAMEFINERFKQTKNNEEFLISMNG